MDRRHLSEGAPRRSHRLGRVIIAVGVNADGRREVLGMEIGTSEAEPIWTEWSWSPRKSVLQKTISAIRPETWEEMNRTLLSDARQAELEDGAVVRLDSTVTSALMHDPSDSSLLWDAVRVMVRLLKQADALAGGAGPEWRDHFRAAKKRRKIQFTRGRPDRVQLYRELIAIACATLAYLKQATERLAMASTPLVELWQAQLCHYRPLIEQIIAQSERRVLAGEQVPAGDKLVSLFEPHADIIVKGSRDTEYGHKLNLTTGRSGMILDLVIEAGQSARQRSIAADAGTPHRLLWSRAAADGGFASRDNLATAKTLGVRDMAFHKKAGFRIEDMVRSNWVYRKLRKLPRRHRGRHLMPQARLWLGALHLARP